MARDARGLARVIVVIGGGWAGCAAAVDLAQRGYRVELHEAAAALGGRARRVARDGLPLDNGEHLLLGAYTETLALAARIRDGNAHDAWRVEPLAITPYAGTQPNALSLRVPHLGGSLGLLVALLRARGLAWRERAATIAWFARQRLTGYRCPADVSVASLLARVPARARDRLFAPLCVAALNTPPDRASGQLFLNVLRDTFGAGARASAIIVPSAGLGDAIPERAAPWLVGHDHVVRTGTRTRVLGSDVDGVALDVAGVAARAEAVVIAVGPHQLASTCAPGLVEHEDNVAAALATVARFAYEPITTIYAGYAAPVPLPRGLVRLDDMPGQWLFDRGDILRRAEVSPARPDLRALLSVVISTSGAHESLAHSELVVAIDAQLRRLGGALPALRWSQVIEERRATYACAPALARPACGRLAPRVYLAGDYTHPTLPATLEAAVRSGLTAAQALARDLPR